MKAKASNSDKEKNAGVVNKKAWRDYEILERLEGGLSLLGTEVKSLRAGGGDLDGSYATVRNNECWLVGSKISPYVQAGGANHQPDRKRKILLHKAEIRKLRTKLEQRGFTLVPLQIYFNARGLAKVELALARGKRKYDKRRKIEDRAQKKDIDRHMKKYRRKH